MAAAETIAAYAAAWRESDEAKRRKLLDESWAEDGVYCDPTARVDGRDALVAHIGGLQEAMPGHSIVETSGVDTHDGFGRFEWEMQGPDGSAVMAGIDFVTFANDGRISQIVGFFGPIEAASGSEGGAQ